MNLRGYYNQAMVAASLMREYSLFLLLFTYLRAVKLEVTELFHFDGCAPNSIKNWVGTTKKWGGGTKKNFFGAWRRNNYYHHCAPPLLKSLRRLCPQLSTHD